MGRVLARAPVFLIGFLCSFIVFAAEYICGRSFTFADGTPTKSLIRQALTFVNESLRTCTLSGVECQKFSRCEAAQARNDGYGEDSGHT